MTAADHLLFVETRGPGQITVLDARTGRLLRRFPSPGYWGQPDSFPLLVAGGTLYAGHLTAFRS
jgi:hypothetical protein